MMILNGRSMNEKKNDDNDGPGKIKWERKVGKRKRVK